MIARGARCAGEKLPGKRAVGPVKIQRHEARALRAEADRYGALRRAGKREQQRERSHKPGLATAPVGGAAVNCTGSLHRL